MSIDAFAIHCDSLKTARLVGWKGKEILNRPFEIELFFTLPAGTDVKSAVGQRATLTASRGDDAASMSWHGVLAKIRLLHQTAERGLYRGLLVPKLWLARHAVRSFVNTKKKILAFTGAALEHGGLLSSDYRFNIDAAKYP